MCIPFTPVVRSCYCVNKGQLVFTHNAFVWQQIGWSRAFRRSYVTQNPAEALIPELDCLDQGLVGNHQAKSNGEPGHRNLRRQCVIPMARAMVTDQANNWKPTLNAKKLEAVVM